MISLLTRLPIQPRIAPSVAESAIAKRCCKQQIADFWQYLQTVSLDEQDYQVVIACMVTRNLPGGRIFDALIAQAARSSSSRYSVHP